MGSLCSELPDCLVVGSPAAVWGWRFPLRVVPPETLRAPDFPLQCAWLSPEVRRLLGNEEKGVRLRQEVKVSASGSRCYQSFFKTLDNWLEKITNYWFSAI